MFEAGRELRHDTALFPCGTNVNFVSGRPGERRIRSVTYERGVEDLTDSCGTGSTASAIAWVVRGGQAPDRESVEVENPGGLNCATLRFDLPDGGISASLKGRTVMVAEGVLF